MAEEFPFRYIPPVDPNIGRRVDHYFVLRTLLGRGGMGAAYLAEHEALAHIKCVIKLVLAELARHPMAISRYRTETEAVSRLKHDNIVKLQNFGVLEDGQLFMRFEYIEGKSLDRYVATRGGRLSLREAAYFIFQLCDALQYAHDCGVIHRDLKPDNLMVEVSPPGSHLTERVKILDFGIAKVVASTSGHTGSGLSMGTPRFMAPEQVTNAAAATGRADVFSLAVIFYLLVTGKLPWGTPESDIAIYHKQKTEAPARPPEDAMPTTVTALVMRALSLVPEDRPTMREFAIELACAIAPEDGLPSGTEILKDVKRSWVMSSLPHAQTLPRPVAAEPIAPGNSQTASALRGDDAQPADGSARPSAPAGESTASAIAANQRSRASAAAAPAGESTASALTANQRSRASAAASPAALSATSVPSPATASALGPAPESLASGHAASTWRAAERPPSPLLAALPTGLVSQKFAAQEPPAEARMPSVVVASEIQMAAGTPGPQPYAHAELPAVVVSTTQLPDLAQPFEKPPAQPVARPEPVPFLVLPGALHEARRARSARGKVAVGVGLLAIAAIGGFVLTRGASQPRTPVVNEEPKGTVGSVVAMGDAGAPLVGAQRSGDAAITKSPQAPLASPDRGAGSATAINAPSGRGSGSPTTEPTPERSATSDSARETAPGGRPPSATVASQAAEAPRATSSDAAKPSAPSPSATTSPASVRPNGELAIIVRPWAAIWLNGKPLADGTPYRAQVPAGRYRVRIANDDLNKSETVVVTVEPHKTTIVERKW